MFVKSDAEFENKKIQELVDSDPELARQHEMFLAEMEFKQSLIEARKKKALSQQEVGELSGLSQQAVSRLERDAGGTFETLFKYLYSLGYNLKIEESK